MVFTIHAMKWVWRVAPKHIKRSTGRLASFVISNAGSDARKLAHLQLRGSLAGAVPDRMTNAHGFFSDLIS